MCASGPPVGCFVDGFGCSSGDFLRSIESRRSGVQFDRFRGWARREGGDWGGQ
ncbi:hypothetical protein Pyn_28758 [Prunus yedoensis var. nudiflora]|uniref:Uncharacterized protein n=1 Tax=Prunus yedoensis var. nudiflora TaxID=2094558 RepID=A0A314YNC9_PRUYE|nr:hypothetical protein Pyn_28758 [Prunus yedoensis var. nudiflora]